MFIPIRTDRRLHHTPWANIALITLNVVIFALQYRSAYDWLPLGRLPLDPLHPRLYQFLTYQFLHGSPMHLIGNMVFLWVFGNSVEDRLGKIGYLAFYLAGGILAGIGHSLLEQNPVVGASGAIAAVTGAYLALFPRSHVTIVYFFFFIGTFELSSLVLILIYIGYDLFNFLQGGGGVAYLAHFSGYAYGAAIGLILLWTRLLPREPFDLLAMLEQWRRRQKFRALVDEGFQPWEGSAKPKDPQPLTADQQRTAEARVAVSQAAGKGDIPAAAERYRNLLLRDPSQVFPQQLQLDMANQLMSKGQHDQAAIAYELFLRIYPGYTGREQVELLLGLIYARYRRRGGRAVELLQSALPRLRDDSQKQMAEQLLQEAKRLPATP